MTAPANCPRLGIRPSRSSVFAVASGCRVQVCSPCVVEIPTEIRVVTLEQQEALAGPADVPEPQAGYSGTKLDAPSEQPRADCAGRRPVVPPEHLPRVVRLASSYAKLMNPAVEGRGGDAQTFKVICTLENDFALPFEAA